MEPIPGLVRVRDMFAHLGMAVALRYASESMETVYGVPVILQIPLPHYPHNRIISGQLAGWMKPKGGN